MTNYDRFKNRPFCDVAALSGTTLLHQPLTIVMLTALIISATPFTRSPHASAQSLQSVQSVPPSFPTPSPRPSSSSANTNRGSTQYFPFADIATVIEKWSPNQHLYVQGRLGLSQSQLMGLESWLHNNGPHWTVILMEDASNQRYTNTEGRIETGMDAVELSISDLMEVGSFGSQFNSSTGEQDAAVFILFQKQRKFSYRASEAQNRRGLGENRWIGKLDRPAYRAMRGGGRILDAVRDTVNSINQSLDRAIAQELKIAQQKRLQRQRESDQLRSRLAEVENKITRITQSAAKIKQQHPDRDSDMANPETASIANQVARIGESIEKTLDGKPSDLGALKESTDQVDNQSDDWIDLYREYDRFATSEKQLEQRKQQLQTDALDHRESLDAALVEIDKMLVDARTAYESADSKFKLHLNSATHALENATQELKDLRIADAKSQARKSFVQRALAAIGSAFTAVFAALFWWLNRKRAPAKNRAVEKLQQREDEVRQELDGMGDLLKRANVVIGDREAIDRKGYQGKTRDLSSKALDDIDQLLIMSSSVDKVIDGAKAKIQPTSLWTKITNWWSPENFNEGYDLLENKPIKFSKNDGIALVRQHDASKSNGANPETDSESQLEGPQEISLSFTELFKIFRQRSIGANETIGQVESGWTKIVSTNRDLQQAIDQASATEQQTRQATEEDGLLDVPQIFDELLKSAQSDQDAAELLGRSDPISAIEGPATTGLRKAVNADQLAEQLNAVRPVLIPSIRQNTQALLEREREVQWVDAALDDFTDRAQDLATRALTDDISQGIEHWRTSFENFNLAVEKSVRLHDRSVDEVLPAITAQQTAVNTAKKTIAERLKIDSDDALAETDRDADRWLNAAADHNAASLTALDRGDPIGAENAIQQALQKIDDVDAVRTQSLTVLDSMLLAVENLDTQIQSTQARLDATKVTLQQLQDSFAKSSLSIEGADWGTIDAESAAPLPASPPVASVPVADLFHLALRQSEKAADAADNARRLYSAGRLLASEESRFQGQMQIDACQHNQTLIQDRAVELQQSVEDNIGNLELLQQRMDAIKQQANQHSVTAQTQALVKSEHQNLIDLRHAIESESVRRDPFNEASAIESVSQDFKLLLDTMKYDGELFEEAKRSVESLLHAISESQSTISRSQRDQIPDSRDVQKSVASLREAEVSASTLKARLATPHEDWRDVDRIADSMLSDATQSLASLQSEIDAAQRAAAEIQSAAASYQQALHWSGSFGIRANPGSARPTLDQARAMLGRGQYQAASQYANQARQHAMNSIASAETEVMRQQAARRRAAERQRRQARRRVSTNRSILGSGGSATSGSWSRSSSSRSSGSSSSSSGRGGFSRSGW